MSSTGGLTTLPPAPALSLVNETVAKEQGDSSEDELRRVAEQFEALFAHMLLKNMRAASLGDGAMDSEQSKLYQDLMDQEMAGALSKSGGLGIAEMLVRQLSPGGARSDPGESPRPVDLITSGRWFEPMTPSRQGTGAPDAQADAGQPGKAAAATDATGPVQAASRETIVSSPQDFVRSLWPLAKRAAAMLGVSPKLVVAQAALETGWGQHAIRLSDGREANNLFGIKAGTSWNGERARVSTTEVLGGVARRVVAEFRAYGSMADSVADYARLLSDSPRYKAVLNTRNNDTAFAYGLERAGYATDPEYGAKILSIANGPTLNDALEALKNP